MALIDVDISDRHEITTLPDMTEAEVKIIGVPKIKDSEKTGGKFLQATLEVVDEPYSKDINHIEMFPGPNDTPKRVNIRKCDLADFYAAFGIEPPVETEDMEGLTAKCILSESDDPDFGMQNRVKKWL